MLKCPGACACVAPLPLPLRMCLRLHAPLTARLGIVRYHIGPLRSVALRLFLITESRMSETRARLPSRLALEQYSTVQYSLLASHRCAGGRDCNS